MKRLESGLLDDERLRSFGQELSPSMANSPAA